MPQQEILVLALHTYLSPHELCALSPIYYGQDLRSSNKTTCEYKGVKLIKNLRKGVTCDNTSSGAPLLTLCIPSLSMYVRAVRLSFGLKGRK